jgi:hypothetical protein
MNSKESNNRHGLFVLGLVTLLLGGAVVASHFDNFTCWSSGFLACVIGLWIMRISKKHGISEVRQTYGDSVNSTRLQRPGVLAWVLGGISIFALGLSFFLLWLDAQEGGHWTWPLYAILVSTLACAVTWGYLFSRMGWFID